nr:MAG: replication initiator protein [Microviridae sp.]
MVFGCEVACTNPYIVPPGRMVMCGRCDDCRIARSREWAIRILHEMPQFGEKSFLTFTYDNVSLPGDYGLDKYEFQLFWKRMRKACNRKIKYFACGEYGERFGRPHYHAICFGLGLGDQDLIEEVWENGFVDVGFVSYKSARYVADYLNKKRMPNELLMGREPPFQLVSQGLGARFAFQNESQILRNGFVSMNGIKMTVPRYYRKKLHLINDDSMSEASQKGFSKKVAEAMKGLGIVKNAQGGLDNDDRRRIYDYWATERRQAALNTKAKLNLRKKMTF